MAATTTLDTRKARQASSDRQSARLSPSVGGGYRWRVVDDPPPPPKLSRFQRMYAFLYEYNKY